jgi:hypothetical protein
VGSASGGVGRSVRPSRGHSLLDRVLLDFGRVFVHPGLARQVKQMYC